MSFLCVLVVKNLPTNGGDLGLIPVSATSPGGGHGYPLQYMYMYIPTPVYVQNNMDRRSWWATVHRVARVDHDLVMKQHMTLSLNVNVNSVCLKSNVSHNSIYNIF